MSYDCKVIADSIARGVRLTTLEVTFPRFILAEVNTHRMLSRNSASSRAIPVERRIAQVRESPFVPEAFGKNKSGMQSAEVLDDLGQKLARAAWEDASVDAARHAERLSALQAHKQHANRVIETYAWHTCVVTATEWENFRRLRTDTAAQPEMQITAKLMAAAMDASEPVELSPGDWHLPYVRDEWEIDAHDRGGENALIQISVARCAAVSFERQNVEKPLDEYMKRHDGMMSSAHWSPFEHQARVVGEGHAPPFAPHYRLEKHPSGSVIFRGERYRWVEDGWFCGPLRSPWLQYRKQIPGEAVWTGGAT